MADHLLLETGDRLATENADLLITEAVAAPAVGEFTITVRRPKRG